MSQIKIAKMFTSLPYKVVWSKPTQAHDVCWGIRTIASYFLHREQGMFVCPNPSSQVMWTSGANGMLMCLDTATLMEISFFNSIEAVLVQVKP